MSRRYLASQSFTGLPLWSTLSILAAAALTGALISLLMNSLGWQFLLIYAIAAITTTLFSEARGIFITIASVPLIYTLGTLISALLVTYSTTPGGNLSRTAVLASVYPILQFFPWLFFVSVLCVIIGVVRLRLLRRQARIQQHQEIRRRRRYAEENRRNRALAQNARRRSEQVTVEEILARNRAANEGTSSGSMSEPRRPQ